MTDTDQELRELLQARQEGKIETLLVVAATEDGDTILVEDRHPGGSPRAVGLLEMLKLSYIYGNLSED